MHVGVGALGVRLLVVGLTIPLVAMGCVCACERFEKGFVADPVQDEEGSDPMAQYRSFLKMYVLC